ncbi:unnamed protein product [Polarella glacialis]|uniref:Uncharacterized protein n=1 Tax=Polarella glacialis TaxID=89957 RepID=A0A813LL97_POLGL|nr:unnamed protein product [Polarella glacialis]
MVCLLLARRAEVDARAMNWKGETPVHYACKYGHTQILGRLLRFGANPAIRTQGRTPLDYASEKGHLGCMELLMHSALSFGTDCIGSEYTAPDREVDARAMNWKGETPVHYACKYGHTQILGRLLRVAHYASEKGHLGCMELLIHSALSFGTDCIGSEYTVPDRVRNHRVQVFNAADGAFLHKWGGSKKKKPEPVEGEAPPEEPAEGEEGAEKPEEWQGIRCPAGVAVNASGMVVVTDYQAHAIFAF